MNLKPSSLFPPFRPFQLQALEALKTYAHTLLIAPTGSGKSLIFQKYLHDERQELRTLLISPLNGLSRQLADGLKMLGLNVKLGVGRDGESPPEGSGIWIISPEKLKGPGQYFARRWQPNFMIVDEAHCVWEWGEKFRPEYAKVPELATEFSIPKTFWCSATLPRSAIDCIEMGLRARLHCIGGFALPEEMLVHRHRILPHQKLTRLRLTLSAKKHESGMIFVSSRASAERLQKYLREWGFKSVFYHAGMSSEERVAIETQLKTGAHLRPVWIVATSAFGMGMNYPFLKTCIVFDPSRTLLSLAQAMGRVGRSGASALAEIYWHENDFQGLESRITDPESLSRLLAVKAFCQSLESPRSYLENYFNEA